MNAYLIIIVTMSLGSGGGPAISVTEIVRHQSPNAMDECKRIGETFKDRMKENWTISVNYECIES